MSDFELRIYDQNDNLVETVPLDDMTEDDAARQAVAILDSKPPTVRGHMTEVRP